jgi:hypothetical protein
MTNSTTKLSTTATLLAVLLCVVHGFTSTSQRRILSSNTVCYASATPRLAAGSSSNNKKKAGVAGTESSSLSSSRRRRRGSSLSSRAGSIHLPGGNKNLEGEQLSQSRRMQYTRMQSTADFRDATSDGRRRGSSPPLPWYQHDPAFRTTNKNLINKASPLQTTTTSRSAAAMSTDAAIPLPRPTSSSSSSSDDSTATFTTFSPKTKIIRLKQWTQSVMESPTTLMRKMKQSQRKRQLARYLKSAAIGTPPTAIVETETVSVTATTEETAATASTATTPAAAAAVGGLSKMDVALFMTYFCNIAVVTLSVVTVPALAAEHFASCTTATTGAASSAFVAGVAGMAPLGGAFGKIINGFVCQRFGGRTASWTYLLALAGVSGAMSVSTGIAAVGSLLMGLEFLSSIQWTSVCHILDTHYRSKPQLMARGIALLSLSSTLGALAAKTVGAGLLQATNWRTVCRLGSVAAIIGAAAMYLGVDKQSMRGDSTPISATAATAASATSIDESTAQNKKKPSLLSILKSILGNRVFWMVGMANSLGYLARGNDRLLGAFLQEATLMPSKYMLLRR